MLRNIKIIFDLFPFFRIFSLSILDYSFSGSINFMSKNPIMAAGHHVKDTLSDAMHRLGVGGSGNHEHTTTNNEHDNTRYLALDTSNIAKVLVIGETGSGKSTFINYLTNYFRGGSLQNIKVAIPSKYRPVITEQFAHCENNLRDTTQSKTDMCNQYIFVDTASPAQRQYLFLDTPGLSDTRGAEQDNINMNKIIDGVSSMSLQKSDLHMLF
jgi:predicted GTPase